MASPGLLLLLMSSSLLLSTVSVSASPDQKQLEEVTEIAKQVGKSILDHMEQINSAVAPLIELIPVAGPVINIVATVALQGLSIITKEKDPVLDALQDEFQSLNSKIDEYHAEQKWDIWAASAFHKPEEDIDTAWKSYEQTVPSLLRATDDNERERFRKEIIAVCSKSQAATQTLLKYLTVKGTSFTKNLAKELAAHVKCHEKDLKEYTVFISKLIYRGSTLNLLCYKLKQTESKEYVDGEADIAYGTASAMFQTHKNCILNSFKYIKPEVEELITKSKKRQQLAHEVRAFLVQNYDRYDWMVVAFTTKHDIIKKVMEKIKIFNSRILTGFIEITKGKVSVGVARQVKGNHTKADEVIKTIKRCLTEKVSCYEVAEKLSQCGESVDGIRVNETYTAVHAFTRKAHDSHDAKAAEDKVSADPQNTSAKTPYIYTGKCKKFPGVKGGKFVVLIKSDEELGTKDPCSKLQCGGEQRGKCVQVKDAFVAMCECKKPYYGQNCKESLDDYKKDLENATEQALQPPLVHKRLRHH